jgi:hypothetical protein
MNGRLISVCCRRRQLDLGLFGRFLEALQSQLVVLQVDALLLLELGGEIFDETHVEVFAAEEGVAIGRLHFEDAVADFENRDIERAAAQVVDGDGLAVLLVEAVGERCCGRLVDDAQHFKAGDLAGVLGCLALGVVEVGRNGDDGLRRPFRRDRILRFPSSSEGSWRRSATGNTLALRLRPRRRHCRP